MPRSHSHGPAVLFSRRAVAPFLGLALPALLTLSGCVAADGPAPAWHGTVDTLPGGGLRVWSPEQGTWSEEERWRLVEELRIGALESGGPDQFGWVADVAVDGEGRLYVLERQAREVRVFDASGNHVRTLGRPGGGPGELGQPLSLALAPGERVWVVDFGNRRYEVFDTAGRRVTSHPFTERTFGFGSVIGSDGLLYERLAPGGPDRRRRFLRRRIGPASLAVVDTIFVPEASTRPDSIALTVNRGATTFNDFIAVPLTPAPHQALVPGKGWWMSEATADYRLTLVGFRGDTVMVVERGYRPVPVTGTARRAAIEALPGEADIRPARLPDVHPPFTAFETGAAGELWVRRQTGLDRVGYDVFSAEGRYLGEVATDLPLHRLDIMEIHADAVYGVLRDELDVPYVVRLRIGRGTPATY